MLRQLLLLPLAGLLLAGASCFGPSGPTAFAGDGDSSGNPPDESASNSGCPVSKITFEDEQTCATCDFGTICGVVQEAPCEVRENSLGDACQLCITSSGVVLYDDCFIQGDVESATCEPSPSNDPDTTCTTCFDALGAAISTRCTPVSDSCTDEVIDGRNCRVCSRDGAVVSTTCDAAELDPRICVVYGNAVGRCVDCFDDNRVVIAHSCTAEDPSTEAEGEIVLPAPSCEQRLVDGVSCTVCYNDAGLFVSQECNDGAPAPQRCERLAFTEQVCQVCVDSNNAVTFVDCVDVACSVETTCRSDADCLENQACFNGLCTARTGDDGAGDPPDPEDAACIEPPTCEMFNNRDGQLCRSCPTSAGGTEVRCMSNTSLVCEVVAESALPPRVDDSVPEASAAAEGDDERNSQGRSCVLCTSPTLNVEVYRDCEGNGAVPPPACLETTSVDNEVCTACFDAVTGGTVYSSCVRADAVEECYGHSKHVLLDATGTALGDDVVTCKMCNDGVQTASCALPSVCGDGLTADPTACTGDVVTLQLTPHQCDNPWASYRRSRSRNDDLAGVMAWSQAVGGFVVVAATSSPVSPATSSCAPDDCNCDRGDVIDVVVSAASRDAAVAFFTAAGVQ